jgi:hypothetical protein
MRTNIEAFFDHANEACGEIHNERALQLELAYYFRSLGAHVQFERTFRVSPPVGSSCPVKSNLDLLVEKDGKRTAIELKVPLNGQHPETLYSFCNDISFIETLIRAGAADNGFCLLVTNDRAFWTDSGRGSPIHNLFRCKGARLSGVVQKPTGAKDTQVVLTGGYLPADRWLPVNNNHLMGRAQYLLLEIFP